MIKNVIYLILATTLILGCINSCFWVINEVATVVEARDAHTFAKESKY